MLIKLADLKWRQTRDRKPVLVGKAGQYWIMIISRNQTDLSGVAATMFIGPESTAGAVNKPLPPIWGRHQRAVDWTSGSGLRAFLRRYRRSCPGPDEQMNTRAPAGAPATCRSRAATTMESEMLQARLYKVRQSSSTVPSFGWSALVTSTT